MRDLNNNISYLPNNTAGLFETTQRLSIILGILLSIGLAVCYIIKAIKLRQDNWLRMILITGFVCFIFQAIFIICASINYLSITNNDYETLLHYYRFDSGASLYLYRFDYLTYLFALKTLSICLINLIVLTGTLYWAVVISIKNIKKALTKHNIGHIISLLILSILPIALASLTHALSSLKGKPYDPFCCTSSTDPDASIVNFFITVEIIGSIICLTLALGISIKMWLNFRKHRRERKPFFMLEFFTALMASGQALFILLWTAIFIPSPSTGFTNNYLEAYSGWPTPDGQMILPTSNLPLPYGWSGNYEVIYTILFVIPIATIICLIYEIVISRKSKQETRN